MADCPIEIDLISDTSTRPSAGMLAAMVAAPLGDEQRDEDPTTRALEARVATLLGHERGLFLPSGTMCNQIAFLVHCRPGDEILCAANAHVFGSEGAGAAALAGAQFRPLETGTGIFTADQVRAALRAPRHRSPRSAVVCVEQTTNRGGGRVWSREALASVARATHDAGLILHMDGARLMDAAVAAGCPASDFAGLCDSAWIDLSKGLGCPVGAVLTGSAAFIEAAWTWKHRLGGAMRQSGILAAAGLYALDHNVDRLAEDHANARAFAEVLATVPGLRVTPEEAFTNMVFLDLSALPVMAADLAADLRAQGIRLNVEGPKRLRVVTHLDVSAAQVLRAAHATAEALLKRL